MAHSEPKHVFAHFLVSTTYYINGWIWLHQVGNAAAMAAEQWESDITKAQKAHIDGFALNIGPQDSYTDQAINTAYGTAEQVGNFSLFLSFDYGTGGADRKSVV